MTRRVRRPPRSPTAGTLELLAPCSNGTEALMLAHGFTVAQMGELVRAGLATATAQRVVAGKSRFEVATLRITEAERRALAQRHA